MAFASASSLATVDDDWSTGLVTFHDALYVPKNDTPFATDVLTVYQRSYYGQTENTAPGSRWPNDYDSPNPVAFITVTRNATFLLALSGGRIDGDVVSRAPPFIIGETEIEMIVGALRGAIEEVGRDVLR